MIALSAEFKAEGKENRLLLEKILERLPARSRASSVGDSPPQPLRQLPAQGLPLPPPPQGGGQQGPPSPPPSGAPSTISNSSSVRSVD